MSWMIDAEVEPKHHRKEFRLLVLGAVVCVIVLHQCNPLRLEAGPSVISIGASTFGSIVSAVGFFVCLYKLSELSERETPGERC